MKTAILVASLVVLTACSSGPVLMKDNDKDNRTEHVERPVAPDRPEPDTPVDKPDTPTGKPTTPVGKPDRPEPDTPVGKPDKPSVGKPDAEPPTGKPDRDHTKSNASANNGKGGNYDKTGHGDNGKGKRNE
jgi:hypothetical protein